MSDRIVPRKKPGRKPGPNYDPVEAEKRRLKYAVNPEPRKAASKKYRDANPEKIYAANFAKYWSDPERRRAEARADYAANSERYKANANAWIAANPEAAAAIRRNYKARKRGAEGFHTAADIAAIFEKQRGRCVYCGRSIRRRYHVDHIIPLSKGGSNWPFNIQLTCESCNIRKYASDPIVFARRLGRLL